MAWLQRPDYGRWCGKIKTAPEGAVC